MPLPKAVEPPEWTGARYQDPRHFAAGLRGYLDGRLEHAGVPPGLYDSRRVAEIARTID
jgi:hypothetical protein